jgi:hypothetical protein
MHGHGDDYEAVIMCVCADPSPPVAKWGLDRVEGYENGWNLVKKFKINGKVRNLNTWSFQHHLQYTNPHSRTLHNIDQTKTNHPHLHIAQVTVS